MSHEFNGNVTTSTAVAAKIDNRGARVAVRRARVSRSETATAASSIKSKQSAIVSRLKKQ